MASPTTLPASATTAAPLQNNLVMGSIGIAVMAIAIVLLVVGIGQMVRAKKRAAARASTYAE
eukprot:CAMPEP_0195522008 /NCGR_PEP_ID=MMETSP0794_2-20130614/19869_1 /TAXON_ID=515487 /ORGANISM="Stephanopyxis turris, Strain CCMP 815" /LENGTH=61 /DNA_ID=CAMNT_0040651681 /DNA_START=67 /DNA_END=252 /DNA_ORIENTATION=-